MKVDGQGGRGGQGGDRPNNDRQGGPPDFAAAAEILGITEQALQDALGGPPPDFAAAAETLNISEDALRAALADAPPPADD